MIKKILLLPLLLLITQLHAQYVSMTVTGNSFSGSPASYVQVIDQLNSDIDNSNALEFQGAATITTFNGQVFVYGLDTEIRRYTVEADGSLSANGSLIFSTANLIGRIIIVNDELAYATSTGQTTLYAFNPSDFVLIPSKHIELELAKPGFNRTDLTEAIVRDDLMFLGVLYRNGSGIQTDERDTASLAVIDLNTSSLVKVLDDHRTTVLGFTVGTNVQSFQFDEQGAILFASTGAYDYEQNNTERPTGVLRILPGEIEFDSTFFYDISAHVGDRVSSGFRYFGSGKAYTVAFYSEEVDATNPFSAAEDPVFKFWELDMSNDTAIELAMPFTKGLYNNWMTKVDDYLICGVVSEQENAIYQVQPNTPPLKLFTTVGEPLALFPSTGLNNGTVSIAPLGQKALNWFIAPNPTSDRLFVHGSADVQYALYAADGQRVLQGQSDQQGIDVSQLERGYYWIQLWNDHWSNRFSVIIK